MQNEQHDSTCIFVHFVQQYSAVMESADRSMIFQSNSLMNRFCGSVKKTSNIHRHLKTSTSATGTFLQGLHLPFWRSNSLPRGASWMPFTWEDSRQTSTLGEVHGGRCSHPLARPRYTAPGEIFRCFRVRQALHRCVEESTGFLEVYERLVQ